MFGTSAGASIAANLAIRHPEVLRAVAFPEPVTAGSLGGVLRVVRTLVVNWSGCLAGYRTLVDPPLVKGSR